MAAQALIPLMKGNGRLYQAAAWMSIMHWEIQMWHIADEDSFMHNLNKTITVLNQMQ